MQMLGIQVVSRAGATLDRPLSAIFSDAGGDIGRGAGCTLVLADPERRISRKQLLIVGREGRHFIRQISGSLVVELNGVPLAVDTEYPLEVGAQLRIGPYLLRTTAETAPATPATPATPDTSAAPPAPAVAPARPQPASAPPAAVRADARPTADDLMEAFGLGRARGSMFGGVLDTPASTGLPSTEGAEPAPPIAPIAAAAPIPPVAAGPMEVDLLVGDPTGTGVRPVAPAAEAIPSSPPSDQPNLPQAQALTFDDLFAALYDGLGMMLPAPSGRSPAQVKLIGGLLRSAIEGTLALLATRTIAKRELGANATLLQTRENNPLKFSPDADAALGHLLGPSQRGFIAPLAAVSDAFDDLRAHEVAVLAGMRAALDEVLSRFDPRVLEQRFAPKAMWENLLPINRKAGLWEHYGEHYAEIMREIEGDFDSLFGRAFLQAYQAQLAQLAQSPAAGAAE